MTKEEPVEQPSSKKASFSLTGLLEQVTLGEPVSWKNLQVFPLTQPNGHDPDYVPIDDLLDNHEAEITEIGEHGHVPTVVVCNRSDSDALILDGMELRGAKQNRMVNVTIIVGKHTETEIPVSCVEQGRWSYRSKGFASARRTVAHKLRSRKAHMVAANLASSGTAATDQGGVWDEVDGYVRAARVSSPTQALDDAFAGSDEKIRGYVDALAGIDALGAVVALNGEIVGVDLLDSRATFRKLWSMLLRGYAMDATIKNEGTETGKSLTREDVEAWLRSVGQSAETARHEVPGVSEYHTVRGRQIAGGITLHKHRAIHMALFAEASR